MFYAAVPSSNTYHLYLDFKHDGVVRTAAFTVNAGGDASSSSTTAAEVETPVETPAHGGHAGH